MPDIDEAVDSPRRLSDDPGRARRLLALVPAGAHPVWGRDELHAGEMWNSNSLISWLIAAAASTSRRSRLRPADAPRAGARGSSWPAPRGSVRQPSFGSPAVRL